MDVSNVQTVAGGIAIHVRRSKTDQNQQGRLISIQRSNTELCPVSALESWLGLAAIAQGPIFRPIDRHGNVRNGRLSGGAVSLIVKRWSARAEIGANGFSGHSLRAGFVTTAASAGLPLWKIRQQTGHRSDEGVNKYIRSGMQLGGLP